VTTKHVWIGQVGPFGYEDTNDDYYGDGVDIRGLRTPQGYIEEAPIDPLEIARLTEVTDLEVSSQADLFMLMGA
jgi:hypothetical protein